MNALLLVFLIVALVVLLVPPLFRMVVKGKIYCLFIEDDGYVKGALKTPTHNNEYIEDEWGAYDIVPDRVGLTIYPKGLPAFFQSIVPCLIYRRNDPVPVIINNPTTKNMSPIELKVGLEPHFIRNLVSQAREGGRESKLQKMMPLLTIASIGLVLVMIFVVLAKVGALETAGKLVP